MGERDELERQQTLATRKLNRGIVAVVSVPIVVTILVLVAVYAHTKTVTLITAVHATLYFFGAGSGGILMILAGVRNHRTVTHQLRDFDERHQLPKARVVIR